MVVEILIAMGSGIAGLLCGWRLYPTVQRRWTASSTQPDYLLRRLAIPAVDDETVATNIYTGKAPATEKRSEIIDVSSDEICNEICSEIYSVIGTESHNTHHDDLASPPTDPNPVDRPRLFRVPSSEPPQLMACEFAGPITPQEFERWDLPSSLKGLPRGQQVIDELRPLAATPTLPGSTFVTAVIRFDTYRPFALISGPGPTRETTLDELVQLARTARSVVRRCDRIGLLNRETMVLAMPQVDHETAVLYANRIRAFFSLSDQECEESELPARTVSVALTSGLLHGDFDSMLGSGLAILQQSMALGANRTVDDWSEEFSFSH